MARLFEYKCKNCGYTKAANPKGHDMIKHTGLDRCVLKCVINIDTKDSFLSRWLKMV